MESIGPGFLALPDRTVKPRPYGITHVLDKGLDLERTRAFAAHLAGLIDIVKIGWGIAYVDPQIEARVAAYRAAGVDVCLGGTLLEICAGQNRVGELARWAQRSRITHLEVSDGLCMLDGRRKQDLIRGLSSDFVVIAETGAKDAAVPVDPLDWIDEMKRDQDAGARWLVAEGRESGTVGLYEGDQSVRDELVEVITSHLAPEMVIFEAPQKAQQVWFIEQLGPGVNLGNIDPDNVLSVETLRLGLRADTARTAESS